MNRTNALIFGLLVSLPAQAQTLADALEQAWSRNPHVAAIAAREAEAQARADVAGGVTPGPAAMSLSSLSDRMSSNRGKQDFELELGVPLWLPGQKAAREAAAESAMAEVRARRAALRLQVAGDVRDAWWAVAAARTMRELAARRVATAQGLEADVLRRFKAGDLARVDANLAQNERLAAEAELIETDAALRQVEQAYRSLTGVAAPALLASENTVSARDAAEDHPQLTALGAAARLARARLKVAEATRRDAPELSVRAVRERTDFTESYDNSMGIRLRVPFSSGARVRQAYSATQAEAVQAEAELAQAQFRLTLDVERTRLDVDAAERQLAMAQARRALTADNLRLAEKSFALGESDLTTLLRMRASAYEAESRFNRQQVARAAALSRYKQSLGVLP